MILGKFKRLVDDFKVGKGYRLDPFYLLGKEKTEKEKIKNGTRTDLINCLLSSFTRETVYLEIGVRDPKKNFFKINSSIKISVDPGFETKENLADFKMTSDEFFHFLDMGMGNDIPKKFDLIFIDGLHLAEQVDRDIANSFKYLSEDGYIVLHDCNPPTSWHAREEYKFERSPAQMYWNGTTWKAFLKWRTKKELFSFCVDSDFGIGVLTKKNQFGNYLETMDEFFEYYIFDKNRIKYLNLISYDEFKSVFQTV